MSSEGRLLGGDVEFSLPANSICCPQSGFRQGTGNVAASELQRQRWWQGKEIFVTLVLALLGGKRKGEDEKGIVNKDVLPPINCQSYREQRRCHFVISIMMIKQCQCEE